MLFKNSCSWHWRITINFIPHLQSFCHSFSKFNTKFDVDPLNSCHFANHQKIVDIEERVFVNKKFSTWSSVKISTVVLLCQHKCWAKDTCKATLKTDSWQFFLCNVWAQSRFFLARPCSLHFCWHWFCRCWAVVLEAMQFD